jgi:hypothetical protein
MDLCFEAIPANPDISGIGVRVAIYIQNILSFIPAFYALWNDGKVEALELRTIETQSTTILITAFAILISAIVQARTFGLSGFHTFIILCLSWMNNTNTFVYFLLYIHHKSEPERKKEKIEPRWSQWIHHLCAKLRPHKRTPGRDVELSGGYLFYRFVRCPFINTGTLTSDYNHHQTECIKLKSKQITMFEASFVDEYRSSRLFGSDLSLLEANCQSSYPFVGISPSYSHVCCWNLALELTASIRKVAAQSGSVLSTTAPSGMHINCDTWLQY